MKVSKAQAILYIFDQLTKKRKITKDDIQYILDISDVTFRRYIQELRAFLINFNEPFELIYIKKNEEYFLQEVSI